MTIGKKRSRVGKGCKTGVDGSKAVVHKRQRVGKGSKAGVEVSKASVGSTHTNPYLYFLAAYQKKEKAANKGPMFVIAKPVFRSRCSPLKLVKVNAALTEDQQDAVKTTGFGSMLNLKCTMLNRDFISRLVRHFNPVSKSLEFGRVRVYTITADDVRRALGLSCGSIPVPTDCQDHHFKHIWKMFGKEEGTVEVGKEEEPLKRGVTFSMMQQVFEEHKADVKFKTSYVLFVLSCFLCLTTKDVAATKFYPAVRDLVQTPTYAWAEFVLDWLATEIAKYKKRSGKVVGGKKDVVGVAGCVLLLMVGSEGEPLIQSLTTKKIKERIAKEETLDLVDPISEQFPAPSFRHPYTIAAFHDLKENFVNQMQDLQVLNAALMGDVPETCTRDPSSASVKRNNRNEDDVDMGDLDNFPSTSTVNSNKVLIDQSWPAARRIIAEQQAADQQGSSSLLHAFRSMQQASHAASKAAAAGFIDQKQPRQASHTPLE
ncbi:hypothetical protein RHGRI_037122 [Rhododendron griersonianum]|uniref:Aminotransferase-like plant mobile domain-containing protein n=1 Tax=Rhododendron griersonianum TaxID=479676 RepID=A0AAV6HQI8_9ERIC|nr:hypothetical protein RHGRI_037122 [Rhododendron griersonianum]